MALTISCPTHPKYRAVLKPRVRCDACEVLYICSRLRSSNLHGVVVRIKRGKGEAE